MSFNYTVSGNDRGLTYIFLEQAKKHAGFNASQKIDWTKVMSVFDEIQKEEQAEGQKLFSGGTDKTKAGWGNSCVINAGDKISLSEEQLNKIYTAMGVDISKAGAAKPPETPETPETHVEKAAPAPEVKSKPSADPNPPAKDPNPPAKDSNPPAKGMPLIEASIKREIYANQTVLTPDGTSYSYDEDGYLWTVQDENGKETRHIYRLTDGSVGWYTDFEYDKNGNVASAIFRNPDGSVDGYYDHEHDKNGNLTREISRNPDGSVDKYYDYEYDKNGNTMRRIDRHPDGSLDAYYNCDQNGNLILMHKYDKDGNEIL